MSGEKNLAKLIASMKPFLAPEEYVFVTLKTYDYQLLAKLTPKSTYLEDEGLSVILAKNKAEEYNIAYSGVFKCITLSVHSSLDAVGLTAAVAAKLTQSNISANVVAAYYHDHIYVAADDAEQALADLNELVQLGNPN